MIFPEPMTVDKRASYLDKEVTDQFVGSEKLEFETSNAIVDSIADSSLVPQDHEVIMEASENQSVVTALEEKINFEDQELLGIKEIPQDHEVIMETPENQSVVTALEEMINFEDQELSGIKEIPQDHEVIMETPENQSVVTALEEMINFEDQELSGIKEISKCFTLCNEYITIADIAEFLAIKKHVVLKELIGLEIYPGKDYLIPVYVANQIGIKYGVTFNMCKENIATELTEIPNDLTSVGNIIDKSIGTSLNSASIEQEIRCKESSETREKTSEKTREKILNLIAHDSTITIQGLAQGLGITRSGVEWQVRELKKSGHLQRIGPTKGGTWKIISISSEPCQPSNRRIRKTS
jgi:Mn-dependent DtxR family transcriptional regulator